MCIKSQHVGARMSKQIASVSTRLLSPEVFSFSHL